MISDRTDQVGGSGIAIVGMTGRFPGANDLETYWRNLRDGVESISFFSDDQLRIAGVPPELSAAPSYVRARGVIEDADLFDAAFFGYSARDALLMDPQQRMFLQCAWEALEIAGYDPRSQSGIVGVYGGATKSSYEGLLYQSLAPAETDVLAIALGNDLPYLPTRVSYKFDLKGPSYPVQTACSTSLVAVHLACQGLLNAECDLAIAGGVSIRLPQESGYSYQEDGILSPDGRCRPFDARARGTLFGNGIGLVVLKRLVEAIADRDTIYAVVKGSAVNNDGSRRASFIAPGVVGQTNVVADALASGEIDPSTIAYVETHGTGTALGDSIEIQALTKAFGGNSLPRQTCAIGSVKSNIGHVDAAAGIAGLIKTVLALQHKQIPPTLHFERPNPDIHFETTPFYVNASLSDWHRRGDTPRRAGVSAFGFGGTNAHVILEEAPETAAESPSRALQIVTLSAETSAALEQATSNLAAHFRCHRTSNLADVAYTLSIGRRTFRYRRAVVCGAVDDAVGLLESPRPGVVFSGDHDEPNRPVTAVFADTRGWIADTGRELYQSEPAFRLAIDECANILRPHMGFDLRMSLFPPDDTPIVPSGDDPRLGDAMVFAVEYATARLLASWGVELSTCLGEGVGECVAACVSGAIGLGDAALVAIGRNQRAALPAAITHVPRSVDKATVYISSAHGRDVTSMLSLLGELWTLGARVDWAAFYSNQRRRRVPLPTYPFQGRRYMPGKRVSPSTAIALNKSFSSERNPSVDDWFYAPIWCQSPLALPLPPRVRADSGVWLVFLDAHKVGERIADHLAREGHEVITVTAGDRFSDGGRRFTIDPKSPEHYERLVEEVCEERAVAGVFHAWGIDVAGEQSPSLESRLDEERVFASVLLLMKALGRAASTAPLRISIVTTGVADVTGIEMISPSRAAVIGLRHVIAQEYPHLICKVIDLDTVELDAVSPARTATLDHIVHDGTVDSSASVVAFRGTYRWVQKYINVRLPEPNGMPARLRANGTYLITGGLGEIGLAIAEYLARTVRARLVLTSRGSLPEESEWDRYLATHGPADLVARRIQRVRIVRQRGGEVIVVTADVANREEMADAFATAERHFGGLHGVIHAAGVIGSDTFKSIAETDVVRSRRQFDAKVTGLAVLDDLLGGRHLDFCLLISSLSAVLGGLGYGAYASANVFLDTAARLRNRTSEFPWLSINWDTWLRTDEEERTKRTGAPAGYVMTAAEGIDALHRILSTDVGAQIVVSTGDLQRRLDQWIELRPLRAVEDACLAANAAPRPNLRTAYAPPNGELERAVTEAFRQGLGLERVGIHDNFFELGGHSLKALEIAARLQATLGTEVRVTMFYEAPTAALLAGAIEARQASIERFADVERQVESRLERLKLRRRGAPA